MSVVGQDKIRLGADNDGGYVVLNDFRPSQPVYSLGVGGDVSFDYALAQKGHSVFQYDHTVDGPPVWHQNFAFSKRAIDLDDGRLDKIMRENGHWGRDDLILNMDIEGDELLVLPALQQEALDKFSQIALELHRVAMIEDEETYNRLVRTLEVLNRSHQIIHVHSNNWGWYGLLGGVPMPDSLELTLVRRGDYRFDTCNDVFPTELDRPCNPDLPDYYLGRLGA